MLVLVSADGELMVLNYVYNYRINGLENSSLVKSMLEMITGVSPPGG